MMNVRRGIALLLVLLLTGCTAEPAPAQPGGRFAPGQYQGTGQGYGGPITVEVEVSADRIEAVSILSHSESQGVCEAAFEEIPAEILRQGTPYVELVAGATCTSQGVIEGAAAALAAAGGTFTPPEPEPEVRTQRELYAGLVIAGAGGSGMMAAAEAVRQGGATVLVVEQQDIIGGETLYEPILTLEDGTLTSGYGLLGNLRAEVEASGAELLTGVKLTGLELTDGRVTGIYAAGADTDYTIHAWQGVILATGGYGGNPELVLELAQEGDTPAGLEQHFRTLCRTSSDGSGLVAAQQAGAAAVGLGQLIFRDHTPEQGRLKEVWFWVDSQGRRLTRPADESEWVEQLLALSGGGAWAVGPARSVEEQPAGTVPIRPEIRLVTAATLEELAERIQADPVLLRQGADQEAETAAGEGVAAEWRTPVLTGTPGGLCTNGQGAVLREDGSVLPGLYAVGTAAAGVDDDGSPRYSRAERVCRFPARAVQAALGKPSLLEQETE